MLKYKELAFLLINSITQPASSTGEVRQPTQATTFDFATASVPED
jgi:hypothetical protein